jgi:hypothetical protein
MGNVTEVVEAAAEATSDRNINRNTCINASADWIPLPLENQMEKRERSQVRAWNLIVNIILMLLVLTK